MNIGIVGAGIAGLTSALKLSNQGHKVYIFEAGKDIGGLAGVDKINISGEEFFIERFYHHFFRNDKHLRELLSFLDLSDLLHFRKVNNAYSKSLTHWYDVFTFGMLFGIPFWQVFKGIDFKTWYKLFPKLLKHPKGYRLLMAKKFYDTWQEVNLSWLWARLHARFSFTDIILGEKLGVVEPSFKPVLDRISLILRENKVELYTSYKVRDLEELVKEYNIDKLVITTPIPVAIDLLNKYTDQEWNIPDYIGAFNAVLFMDEAPGQYYWEQFTDVEHNPFLVKVEQSLLNKTLPFKTIYVGGYIKQDSYIFNWSDEKVLSLALGKFNFNEKSLIGYKVYKTRFAQHVPTVTYIKNMPPRNLQIEINNKQINVDLLSFGNLIPWDRGVNYSIFLK